MSTGTSNCPTCGARPEHQTLLLRSLSERELEIVTFISNGKSNKEIAKELGLSPLTVKSHLSRMSKVLGTGDRAKIVAIALREGMIT